MRQASGLTKHYGTHPALTDLNLSIAPGNVYGLPGANGAGKTTTINLFSTSWRRPPSRRRSAAARGTEEGGTEPPSIHRQMATVWLGRPAVH
jgi:ABC-type multidrug transport system ATPase subunit